MTIHLTQEQERRIQDVINAGAYKTVEQVMEAALAALEQRTQLGFEGTPAELESLLLQGLDSKNLSEREFWAEVQSRTTNLADDQSGSPR